MTTSLTVKQSIISTVSALPAVAGYQVTWSLQQNQPKQWIMVGKIDYSSGVWKTNRQYEENYSIDVVINCILPGGTALAVESEVLRVHAAIAAALTPDPTFAGVAVTSLPAIQRVVSWPTPDGFEGQCDSTVSVTARQAR
ncbi:hypothetical protein [Streptacidiphilus albus]|uniref:hypothetical protein n=1 Tax=Streptacidiphilus albus TaxID=105425 RepID=UPI00054B72CF|nr:hypothetical protein [Streptacidiphilus albus]